MARSGRRRCAPPALGSPELSRRQIPGLTRQVCITSKFSEFHSLLPLRVLQATESSHGSILITPEKCQPG